MLESRIATDGRDIGGDMAPCEQPELLTRPEAATLLRMKPATLAQMAYRGVGPRFLRPDGGRALYRRADLEAWLTGGEVVPGRVG